MKGAIKDALDCFSELHDAGAEPQTLLQDLLELCHWLTRLKHVPAAAEDPAVPEAERTRGRAMAEALAVPSLTQTWQMLLKGLEEVEPSGETRACGRDDPWCGSPMPPICRVRPMRSRAIGTGGNGAQPKDAPAASPAPAPAPSHQAVLQAPVQRLSRRVVP